MIDFDQHWRDCGDGALYVCADFPGMWNCTKCRCGGVMTPEDARRTLAAMLRTVDEQEKR